MNGKDTVFIAGRDIRDFGAYLQTDYRISGQTVTQSLCRGRGDVWFHALGTEHGMLTVELPLDFHGAEPETIAGNMAALRGLCRGAFFLEVGDGFLYRCCLTEAGECRWSGMSLCSQTLTLAAQRLGQSRCVKGTLPLTLYNPGTWEKTGCRLILRGFTLNSQDGAHINLFQNGTLYQSFTLEGTFSGKDLLLDGMEKRIRYGTGTLPAGSMVWTEYPYLLPGTIQIVLDGGGAESGEVEFYPAFV